MDALQLLQHRNSSPRLVAPAPNKEQRQQLFRAAFRAPDHGWMRPWRFLTIEGPALAQLGELYARAAAQREVDISDATLEKYRRQPLRAPLIVVVCVHLRENPKVPMLEQRLAAGCAAQAVLLAAEAMGYAGIWRTGVNATDALVRSGLGLGENDEIIGFVYLGSREGDRKVLPRINIDDYVKPWGEQ